MRFVHSFISPLIVILLVGLNSYVINGRISRALPYTVATALRPIASMLLRPLLAS